MFIFGFIIISYLCVWQSLLESLSMVYLSLLLCSVDPLNYEWNSDLETTEKPYIKHVCRREEK